MDPRKAHDSVSVDIAAPPERVYELVSDITRMGEWTGSRNRDDDLHRAMTTTLARVKAAAEAVRAGA